MGVDSFAHFRSALSRLLFLHASPPQWIPIPLDLWAEVFPPSAHGAVSWQQIQKYLRHNTAPSIRQEFYCHFPVLWSSLGTAHTSGKVSITEPQP